MKRVLSSILAICMIFSLAACSNSTNNSNSNKDTNNTSNKVEDKDNNISNEAEDTENNNLDEDEENNNSDEVGDTENIENVETENVETENIGVESKTAYQRATQLLSMLHSEKTNVMISPLSIEMAIEMAANGMNDEALSQVEQYIGEPLGKINTTNQEYMESILDDEDKTLSIANSLWIQDIYKNSINKNINSILKQYYNSDLHTFVDSWDPINEWVSDNTNEMIKTLGTDPEVLKQTTSILINAIYFNGKWIDPFDSYRTQESDFSTTESDTVQVDTMYSDVDSYMVDSNFEAFRKLYRNGYSFVGIRPIDGVDITPELIDSLDIENLLKSETDGYEVNISIPKFELEYNTSLTEQMKQLGLTEMFEPNSIDKILDGDDNNLNISDIIHKTAVKMNEDGTEAAAVTGAMMELTSFIENPKEIKTINLDKPFIYLILDSSDQVLFIGTVDNPLG